MCKEDKKLNRPRIFKTLATDPIELVINDLIEKYEEKFQEDIIDDPGIPLSREEWVKVLRTCIEENKTFEEVTGYDDIGLDENDYI
jgi:hypothetical protein|nr:MAG TPA: hypothetical protein [Caudoviricetes sp.]